MFKERHAIIDIGSNAIRASVYSSNKLGAYEIYNDKFKSDILGLLELDELDIKHHTYLTFQHFMHIFSQLKVSRITCIATAVLRNHANTQNFVNLIKYKFNVDIRVISGTEEAHYGALGVLMAINGTNGIIADFGGGSLELSTVNNTTINSLVSLPLGSKKIQQNRDITVEEIINMITSEYNSVIQTHNLYFIGGALRLIGRLYMNYIKYPLNNLHNLEISKYSLLAYLEKIDNTVLKKQFFSIYNNTLNNIENLPAAIKVSKALIEVFNPEKIIISNYGLKEGVRFTNLSNEERAKDIVYERCIELFEFLPTLDLTSYINLVNSILPREINNVDYLIRLALIANNGFKSVDKSLRASYFSELILSTDIPFSHNERVILALIMSFSYRSKSDLRIHKLSKKIISFEEYYLAQIIGNILRVVRQIDGPELTTASFSFNLKGGFIEIVGANILPKPIFNKVCAHLKDISFARKKIIFKNFTQEDE